MSEQIKFNADENKNKCDITPQFLQLIPLPRQ